MSTVPASIPVLKWAALRARLDPFVLEKRFRKWSQWLTGQAQPTLRQLEDFARLSHTPIGYFFLPQPPKLTLPLPDFRTVRDRGFPEPSCELLDTIYLCQQRQDWYHEFSRLNALTAPEFVGSVSLRDDPRKVAGRIRETLHWTEADARQAPTWTDALRLLISRMEAAGILVMASSVVGSNSHRKLDVEEFRGFSLTSDLAPLIFLNGADSKSAQMFTLAHELAHVWLGESGISNPETGHLPTRSSEQWCNRVAAEFLLPLASLQAACRSGAPIPDEIQRLARHFKVSTLVVLRRLYDAGLIDQETLRQEYGEELRRISGFRRSGSGGGDFYRTLGARTGKRFAQAVLVSTLAGQTLFKDAFRMLGIRKSSTFYDAARELGVTP